MWPRLGRALKVAGASVIVLGFYCVYASAIGSVLVLRKGRRERLRPRNNF